jgi:hypothetical protein
MNIEELININIIQHSMPCYYCIGAMHALSNPLIGRFGSCCALGLPHTNSKEQVLVVAPLLSLTVFKDLAEHARLFVFILHIHRSKDGRSTTFPRRLLHRCRCLGRFLDIIGRNPSVSKPSRLHVVVFQFVSNIL